MMSGVICHAPIGLLRIEADDVGICAIRPSEQAQSVCRAEIPPVLAQAIEEMEGYFSGTRQAFSLPLSLKGTAFERSVWQALMEIPYGETCTYGGLAAQLGWPGSARAVGRACGANPLLIVVPCHRVIAASGALTGFAAGMQAKRTLLALEGHEIRADRITAK